MSAHLGLKRRTLLYRFDMSYNGELATSSPWQPARLLITTQPLHQLSSRDVTLSTMLEMGGIQGWLEDALTMLASYGRLRLLLSSSPDDVLSTFNGWGFV